MSYDTKHYHTYRKDYVKPADDAPRIDWILDPPEKVAMQDFGFWKGPEVRLSPVPLYTVISY